MCMQYQEYQIHSFKLIFMCSECLCVPLFFGSLMATKLAKPAADPGSGCLCRGDIRDSKCLEVRQEVLYFSILTNLTIQLG